MYIIRYRLLVVLFFFTLWHRPWVLYGPSDFKNEKNFLDMFTETQRSSLVLDGIITQIKDLNKKIISEVFSFNDPQKGDMSQITELLSNETTKIISRIDSARSSFEQCSMNNLPHAYPQSQLQNNIFLELRSSPEALTFTQICGRIKRSGSEIKKAVDRMVKRNIIKKRSRSGEIFYALNLK